MTDKSTIQSWPREQLESAFTQREVQLAEVTQSFHQSEAENYELQSRLGKAENILESIGYRRCDIAACNCNGYHQQREEPEV